MNSIFNKKTKEESTTYDTMSSLSHTKWNCKYHIVFTPKYRRKIFYGQKRLEIGKILREISDWQEVKIIEAEVCPDHVHMFVSCLPTHSPASVMKWIKGASSNILRNEFKELNAMPSLWTRSYFVSTAGNVSSETIKRYVDTQKTRA